MCCWRRSAKRATQPQTPDHRRRTPAALYRGWRAASIRKAFQIMTFPSVHPTLGRALTARGYTVPTSVQLAVLEKESAPGTGVSSRSSEVIHAGIYYPPASLKARLCVEGNVLLREFCSSFGVAFRQTGKVIVAVRTGDWPTQRTDTDGRTHHQAAGV